MGPEDSLASFQQVSGPYSLNIVDRSVAKLKFLASFMWHKLAFSLRGVIN
jgi:hypothetical protein